MYLRTLGISGFKCFGDPFTIEFHDGLNVLVGENGAGKTGVIAALRQLFNDSESGKRVISERDFHRGFEPGALAAQRIEIQASFSGLDENDVVAFEDWCGDHDDAKWFARPSPADGGSSGVWVALAVGRATKFVSAISTRGSDMRPGNGRIGERIPFGKWTAH